MKLVKILSIDGGGMRGIIPAMIVAEIERITGKPVTELFDLMSGTSTGGILATFLAAPDEKGKPKFSGTDMVKIYEDDGPTIFANSPIRQILTLGNVIDAKYPSAGMKQVFNKHLGKLHLKEALTNLLVPAYEIEMGAPFFFKSSEAKKDLTSDFLMQDVIMATSASPTFFEPYTIEPANSPAKHLVFCDGGVVASNPTMCAYVEAKTLFPDAGEYLIVSLGAGEYSAKMLAELSKGWGQAQWVRPLINIMISGSVDVVDHQMRTLFATSGDQLNHYYRFQLPITDEEAPLDDAEKIKLHELKAMAENLIRDNKDTIHSLCDKLV